MEVITDKYNDHIKLLQTGLINKVIKAVGMEDCNGKTTPANDYPLVTDGNGEKMVEPWNYASIIGMLLYLASNSRPDIKLSVHQCARFTHNPKQSHANDIKRIIRYLKVTNNEGLRFTRGTTLTLDCYADADFAGLWNAEDGQDPVCVRSRKVFVLTLGTCPFVWVSKFQTETSLSTLEAEYIAFYSAMREILPMRQKLIELGNLMKADLEAVGHIHSVIFEDNNGALNLSNYPKITPRTNHIAIKYHWFRDNINNEKEFLLQRIDSGHQKADIFTKGMTEVSFRKIRALLMGW